MSQSLQTRWIILGLTAVFLGSLGILTAQTPPEKTADLKFTSFESSKAEYDRVVAPFLAKHCIGCHGPKKVEGELALDKLEADMKASTSAARWAMLLDKLATREMPPEGRPQPDDASILAVTKWIQAEMKRAGKYAARRQAYSNGNQVAHHLLFDPNRIAPLDVGPRLRRLSPEIYEGFTNELAKGAGISQPFSPEGKSTFKDMGAPRVDEPVTAQLIQNALLIVEKQTGFKVEGGEIKAVGFAPKEFLRLFDETRPPSDAEVEAAVKSQFERVLRRSPTADERTRFVAFYRKTVKDAGAVKGTRYMLAAVFLLPEAIFRWEGGGEADATGKVRLTGREIAFALAYALGDRRPDSSLLVEAEQGKLDTKAGVEAAVKRLLEDAKVDRPRILRFFREYFGYPAAREVFKNDKDNPDHDPRILVEDTDKLIEYILAEDKQVLRELLTTNKSFVAYKTAADTKKKRAESLAKFEEQKKKEPEKFKNKTPQKVGRDVFTAYGLKDFPDQQPVELPTDQRAGILTQPSWLVAHSTTDDNHAIHRGKWIRERLLGGVVPDIPITVDAQLPIAPEKTLRERMAVTQQEYCWKCHQLMNDLAYPFEQYDHFGRYRTGESVLDPEKTAKNVDPKGKNLGPVLRQAPLNTTGLIAHVGDRSLEGPVTGPVEYLKKLADSERVEQVFIRHVFRFWMGRNETLGDAAGLQAMHRAYRDSNGSMKALLTALLTSESFLYRVRTAR